MGVRSFDHAVKSQHRKQINLPGGAGDYATEVLEFGGVPSGVVAQSYARVTAWLEGLNGSGLPSGVVGELWLARLFDANNSESGLTTADYYFAGRVVCPAGLAVTVVGADVQYGCATWEFGGIPGGQVRFRSGGAGGSFYADLVAF